MQKGDLVYIQYYPDDTNKCKFSGCPIWRPAVGIVIEKLYEYNGSQLRVVVLVEGKEKCFMNYQLKLMEK